MPKAAASLRNKLAASFVIREPYLTLSAPSDAQGSASNCCLPKTHLVLVALISKALHINDTKAIVECHQIYEFD